MTAVGEHGGFLHEPVKGLPGRLPEGETLLWQGSPDWKRLALSAFHVRGVLFYFALLALWAVVSGSGMSGLVMTLAAALAAVALLGLLAYVSARASVYTLTNRRVVLRIGAALPTCINVPLSIVETAGLKRFADGTGDIPLALGGRERVGYALLWPHARPWHLSNPQPMLRSVPDVDRVVALLGRALADAQPEGRRVPLQSVEGGRAMAGSGKAVAA